MKKILLTILAFVYLVTTTGAALNLHYCMGKLSSVDLRKSDKCSRCGMKNMDGCCKDEYKVIKLQGDHQLAINHIQFLSPFILIEHNFFTANTSLPVVASSINIFNNSPPGSSGRSICILNSVFRV